MLNIYMTFVYWC